MDYQIFINHNEVLAGDLNILVPCLIVGLFILLYLIRFVIRKLRMGETMRYEFITIIAHKFRTPLTQIKWIIESTLPLENDPFKKEGLQNMSKSAETLIGLTNTLVELTNSTNRKSSSYNFERLNICDVVAKISDSLKNRFHEKNIFFGITCAVNEIYVEVDRPRIEFVLQTLLENSINYSHPGGNVKIDISINRRDVHISIADQGIGIAPADANRLFSKFFRAKSAQTMDTEGFGVGLYLANSIVKKHSGYLEFFSEGVDKGTTFTVVLPIVK